MRPNIYSPAAKETKHAVAILALLISLSPSIVADRSTQPVARRDGQAHTTTRPAATPDLEVKELVSTYGTLSPTEFVNWLHTILPEKPAENTRRSWVSNYTRYMQMEYGWRFLHDTDLARSLKSRAQPVLTLFRREDIPVLIAELDEPVIESMPASFICVSTGFIKLVKDDTELNAWFGHELAHELTWPQAQRALRKHDLEALRRIELGCDAVSAVALAALGLEPRRFGDTLRRLINWSPLTAALNNGSNSHPSLAQRILLNRQISDMLRGASALAENHH